MKNTFLLFFLLIGNISFAQGLKAYIKAGDKAFENKDYSAALQHYKTALEFDNDNIDVFYQYAEVARNFYAYPIAEEYYLKVLNDREDGQFPELYYQLAMVKKGEGEYGAAQEYFQKYIAEQGSSGSDLVLKARNEVANCKWAAELMKEAEDLKIQHLDKKINTPYSEFGAIQRGDTLYYSSFRFEDKKDTQQPRRRIAKVLTSLNGAKGRTLRRKFNVESKHTAHTTFSKNGKRIYFTQCEYLSGINIRCAIYYREMDSKKRWGKAKKIKEPINLEGYTNTQPHIAIDESGKETLYFVSDRPDGKGKLDIWSASISPTGKFGKVENVSSINTAENDITPFYHQTSQTLYFSSDGYQGLGGYDIFKAEKKENEWSKASHTGYPLNSSFNDIYYSLNEEGTRAYFSSNRLGSMYLNKNNKACCNDIYKVNYQEEEPPKEEPPVVIEEPTPPIEAEPTPQPTEPKVVTTVPPKVVTIPVPQEPTTLEDFLPLALYFHNDEPDRRTRKTTTKKTYGETYDSYIALQSLYKTEYTRPLHEDDVYDAEVEIDDFFYQKVEKGYRHLGLFSNILLTRLQQGEQVEIFIKGFTSPRAKSDYNELLAKRRISSVNNHFRNYQNGIFLKYLNTKQLIISERAFGETTAAQSISDRLDDQRNSIYSVPAASERRVEIVEIRRSSY